MTTRTVIVPTPQTYNMFVVVTAADSERLIAARAAGGGGAPKDISVKIGDVGTTLFEHSYPTGPNGVTPASKIRETFDEKKMLVENITVTSAMTYDTKAPLGLSVYTQAFKTNGTPCLELVGTDTDRVTSKTATVHAILMPEKAIENKVIYNCPRKYDDRLLHSLGDVTPAVVDAFKPSGDNSKSYVTTYGPMSDFAYEVAETGTKDAKLASNAMNGLAYFPAEIAEKAKVKSREVMANLSRALIDPSTVQVSFTSLDGTPLKAFSAVVQLSFTGVPRSHCGWAPGPGMDCSKIVTADVEMTRSSMMYDTYHRAIEAKDALEAKVIGY